jgi:predicted aspartyl protease
MYTHNYDSSYPYGPALPVASLTVKRIAADDAGIDLRAMVDSGADATILPLAVLQQAQIERVGRARMRWGFHQSHSYDVYLATIVVGPYIIYGVRVLADPANNEAILGRDVLNQMIVTLNGLANVVEISQ